VGFAAGRDVVLADNPEVRANLYVCLFGHTGMGKSRATGALTNLLAQALPYDHSDQNSTGTYLVPSPGSAEALVDAFSKEIDNGPGTPIRYGAVRGLVRFDELSTLIGRASRAGNPMKPALMEFFDGYHAVEHKTRGMGHVRAENYFASTLTSTQPKSIRRLLGTEDADSGFANRWVFAAGKEKPSVAYGRQPLDIASCVPSLAGLRAWAAMPGKVRHLELEGSALDLWTTFYFDVLEPAKRADESGLMTRSDLLMKKIMLLFTIDRKEPLIDVQTVRDAIGLWDYIKASYGLVSPEVGMGEFEHIRVAVRDFVVRFEARKNEGASVRDISRGLARHKFPSDMLLKVVKTMAELEELRESIEKPKRGPAKATYRYAM
jgi:energy-coupling factor transporter ATP-binding protein EcfA2